MEKSLEFYQRQTREHLDQYQELDIIGRGSFGIIRKVRHKATGRTLVRKEIPYKSLSRKEQKQLRSEFNILKRLDHPSIVHVYFDFDAIDKQKLYIYMEYCDDGDLGGFIKKHKEEGKLIPETIIWQIFTQLLLALYRCHYGIDIEPVRSIFKETQPNKTPEDNPNYQIILHRDIKPENIFLLQDKYTVKLGDFGLAKLLAPSTQFTQTYVGTPYYMPPEVVNGKPYTRACDMWSLGCVIYELCSLEPPFKAKTHNELQEKIKLGIYNEIPNYYSSRLSLFIKACLMTDPVERGGASLLLQHSSMKIYRKEWELNQREFDLLRREAVVEKSVVKLGQLKSSLLEKQKQVDEKAAQLNLEYEKFRLNYNNFHQTLDLQVNEQIKELIKEGILIKR